MLSSRRKRPRLSMSAASSIRRGRRVRLSALDDFDPANNNFELSACRAFTCSEPATTSSEQLRLNVGGQSFCVRLDAKATSNCASSLVWRLAKASHLERLALVDDFDETTGEYYLERSARLADHIIDFFSTGSLHKPNNVCIERFKEELAFWNVGVDQLSPCCAFISEVSQRPRKSVHDDDARTEFDGLALGKTRYRLWALVEDPQGSVSALVFAFLSVFFVFASVIGLILGSMPEFQEDPSHAQAYHYMHVNHPNGSLGDKFHVNVVNKEFPDFVYKPTDSPNRLLVVLEYVCIGWFTFEYLLRLIISPKKYKFFMQTLNMIDLFTILPFYLELTLPLFGISDAKFKELTGAMIVIRVLRVLRMARVFKLARYSTSLQTFGHTLKSSMTELSMLSMFLVTGIIFFSTVMHFLEKDEPHSDFSSIPASMWWCVVTMATVGYGDAKPITTFGKLVATAASICGIIVLAFPISMIVEKFATAQQKALEESQLQQANALSSHGGGVGRGEPLSPTTIYKEKTLQD